jgi:lipopolysaccharide transport system ATP-binding protein
MYVRLAFAVAAHLEPEILIVDEVLAVGDQQFQKKCLGKMNDVASGGRAVLVVSHNMSIVSTLCDRAMLLASGQVQEDGPVEPVLRKYTDAAKSTRSISKASAHRIDKTLLVTALSCCPEAVQAGGSLRIHLELTASEKVNIAELCVLIYHSSGQRVAVLDLRHPDGTSILEPASSSTWEIEVPSVSLVDGDYSLGIYCRTAESKGDHYEITNFTVVPGRTGCLTLPYAAQHRGFAELDYHFVRKSDGSIVD